MRSTYRRYTWELEAVMQAPAGAKRVLVVDDEPNIVTSIEFLMKRAGFDVEIARDGNQALKALDGIPPDIILLDVMMPGLDGYEVCQYIRQSQRLTNTKIVMLTARGREMEKQKGLNAGADAYVTKPFSTRDLVKQVQDILAADSSSHNHG